MLSKFRSLVVLSTVLLVVTLLAAGVAGASGHNDGGSMQMDGNTMQMMEEAIGELEGLEGEEFEVAYVDQIIPHHQGALDMAQAVVDRAPNPEVRDAAARIIEDQNREIEELTTFLQDTYGREVQPDERMAMDPSMMEQMHDADPAAAETMFLLMMREHHQSATEMGQIALEKAQSQEILSQAETMVSSQQAEQEEFAGYLRNFYGIEAPEPTGDMERAMRLAVDSGTQMPDTGGPPLGSVALVAVLLPVAAGAIVVGFVRRRWLSG